MKIIQSFAQFKEGSPYVKNVNTYLNFYTFLLSYLTLKKYYGRVTMICNQTAYDTFIKYIPYDEIIFVESSYSFELWGAYKLDAMKLINDDYVHVDSDVFIFDDLFRKFIDSNSDVIIQNYLPSTSWCVGIVKDFINTYSKFLKDNQIITIDHYDNRFSCCAVSGCKIRAKNLYLETVGKLEQGMKTGQIVITNPMILEEVSLHFTILKHGLKVSEVLPYNLVCQFGNQKVGDIKKYTHMNSGTKFKPEYIELIKNKINNAFPDYYSLVEKYDRDVCKINC